MKRIKIFLASSIEDLREDRLQVGDFFRQLNELYLDRGVHFSLIKCEDYDNALISGGKQQEYDREIRESELVFFLFFRKVGDYTKHEFEVALEAYASANKPKILTYFKHVESAEEVAQDVRAFMLWLDGELKHYYTTYGHIDTLKLGIVMQIKLMQLDDAQVTLKNGEVLLDGHTVAKAENVPLLHGNQTLRALTEQYRQLQQELGDRRAAFLSDPTPEKEAAFFDVSAQLNQVSKQLTKVEEETMALVTTVAEMTADGKILTHRQKEALKYFHQGDYAAVQAILKDAERENALCRAQGRAEVSKQEIQGYVNEELLLIKTETAMGLTEEGVLRILSSYQKIAELVEKHDLEKSVLYDHASFLWEQNRFSEAIAVAEKLRWYYSNPSATVQEQDIGAMCNLLGNLYSDTQRHEEAEKVYLQALEIRRRLATQNPDAYEPGLAMNYNDLGNVYSDTQRHEEAEKVYLQALEIRRRLAARNPDAYEQDLADSYNNLGILYSKTQRHEEAEKVFLQALEIRQRLAAQNPAAYAPDLAEGLWNLAAFYLKQGHYAMLQNVFRNALPLFEKLAEQYPNRFQKRLEIIQRILQGA